MTEGFGYMSKTGIVVGFLFLCHHTLRRECWRSYHSSFCWYRIFALGLLSMPVMKEARPEKGSKSDERM